MGLTYAISGYRLPGTTQRKGIWLLDGTEYAPALSVRHTALEIPNRHYEIPNWSDPLSAITVGMTLRLRYPDVDGLRGGWDLLTGLLGMGTNAPVPLERIRKNSVDYADSQLVSSSTPDFASPTHEMAIDLIMNIPGGAWRGPQVDEYISAGSNQSCAVAEASTRPIADALLRVPGPLNTLTVTDNISNTGIFWGNGGQTIPLAKWLLIDVGAMTARIVSTDTWDVSQGTAASGSLVFTGMGPLTLTSRRSGSMGLPSSSLSVTTGGGTHPMTIRTRKAVV